MEQNSKPQTFILEKQIKGQHEQASLPDSAVEKQAPPPVPAKPEQIPASKRNPLANVMILLLLLIAVLISCITIYDSLHIGELLSKFAPPTSNPPTVELPRPPEALIPMVEKKDPGSITTPLPISQPEAKATGVHIRSQAFPKLPASVKPGGDIFTADPPPDSGGISTTSRRYIYQANRGEGVTHLARRAMLDYLADHNIQLTAQQKMYFESRLTNESHPVWLEIGEAREFHESTLDQIAHDAAALSESQQSRWNKYLKYYPLR